MEIFYELVADFMTVVSYIIFKMDKCAVKFYFGISSIKSYDAFGVELYKFLDAIFYTEKLI